LQIKTQEKLWFWQAKTKEQRYSKEMWEEPTRKKAQGELLTGSNSGQNTLKNVSLYRFYSSNFVPLSLFPFLGNEDVDALLLSLCMKAGIPG
jgi:hypothetical protein